MSSTDDHARGKIVQAPTASTRLAQLASRGRSPMAVTRARTLQSRHPPHQHNDFAQYRAAPRRRSTTLRKTAALKDRMNTTYAKEVAKQRHAFMEQFLDRFSGVERR